MSDVFRVDRGQIKGHASRTDEGYIRAQAAVTRTGVFLYRDADGSERRELRHPNEVFSADSIRSMQMIPITNQHPAGMVNKDNAKDLTIGHVGEAITVDAPDVLATLAITDGQAIQDIDAGRVELSLGYTCVLVKEDGYDDTGQPYTHRQTNIRYNHLSVVDRARAGAAYRLNLDSGAFQTDDKQEQSMTVENLKTVTLDGIDYSTPPEVAVALDKANARADAAEEKVKTDAAEATKKLDAVQAKLDAAEEKLAEAEKRGDDDAINTRVRARVDLESKAREVLKGDDDAIGKLSEMKDGEIKRAVIAKVAPDAKLDGKSDAYIDARFDVAIEAESARKDAMADQRRGSTPSRTASKDGADDPAKRADDAMQEMKDMWKPKKTEDKE